MCPDGFISAWRISVRLLRGHCVLCAFCGARASTEMVHNRKMYDFQEHGSRSAGGMTRRSIEAERPGPNGDFEPRSEWQTALEWPSEGHIHLSARAPRSCLSAGTPSSLYIESECTSSRQLFYRSALCRRPSYSRSALSASTRPLASSPRATFPFVARAMRAAFTCRYRSR